VRGLENKIERGISVSFNQDRKMDFREKKSVRVAFGFKMRR
jgi:hypothetical protein